ncbi:fumarylacetoacetate hydrolase family protein [Microbacteriaceae bacterium K1510]|nr:fumarylacetoacetate hydrolase family protein [Microbacteriaceae bacterium K1510]
MIDVTPVLEHLPSCRYPLPRQDPLIANLDVLRSAIEREQKGKPGIPYADVVPASPLANPGKIVAAPVNYKKHLDEAREDAEIHHQNQVGEIQRVGLFLKATSSLIGPSEPIVIRHPDRRTDHEIELAVVIGKTANRVSRERALDYIAGYCIGLDITVRGPEERSLRKSIDTYTVLGPWLVTPDELGDPSRLELELSVNGEARQKANTRDLIIDVPDLIAFASSFYTLMPGDVLLTGTPEGVGPIKPGDRIESSISSIGTMQTRVAPL